MVGRIIFCIASVLFLCSLVTPAVLVAEDRTLAGVQTFIYTLRYGTANLFAAGSFTDVVVNFVALIASGANFVFVFWAMLVLTPTRIPALRWFWWISLIFLLAALYTGIQAALSGNVALQHGYFMWMSALVLMLVAPVVSRVERRRSKGRRSADKKSSQQLSRQAVKTSPAEAGVVQCVSNSQGP